MGFIDCQLAVAGAMPFVNTSWIFEPKYDGYRAQIHFTDCGLRLYTRSGLDWTHRFLKVLSIPLPAALIGTVLDAEICALDPTGRPDFTRLGRSFQDGDTRIEIFAFDILADRDVSIMGLPLIERKARLNYVVKQLGSPVFNFVNHTTDGAELANRLRSAGWEGSMAKDPSSPYLSGVRSPAWRKFKFKRRQEFIITGWRPDPVTGELKSIAIATYDGDQLRHHGFVASGFSHAERSRLASVFSSQPAATRPPVGVSANRAVWVEPRLVAEVEFLEMTPAGMIRCGAFLGFRDDKSPADVVLERSA